MIKKTENITLELKTGNIVKQHDTDAIVNAANAELKIGGGVAGAIHSAGDPELEQLTRPLAPIKPGEAVITEAPNLPNRFVIHCLGPVYGRDEPADTLLARCYKNALTLAEENQLESIAFPAISTGAFGFPMKDAARIAIQTVLDESKHAKSLRFVTFVLFDEKTYSVHAEVLKSLEI
ncbi:RNase III inhibitor [Rhodohalobacter sp. SW132]|uniref:macro domain-containing protein n=1 Tax=Rhodohalobacter sp. SW132 TaxID=2293433 RepID=UPI000E25B818|nr:macro domain-containing protein [Rhodohalobacter sp. SW132]REL33224.1 RNase III inhibitor [Rhodohalobacter sp. SW132]